MATLEQLKSFIDTNLPDFNRNRAKALRAVLYEMLDNVLLGQEGAVTWGNIGGDIYNQTDLLELVNGKPVENIYNDIAELLADQVNQTIGYIQKVINSSADPNTNGGIAYYEYLGTTGAVLGDYDLLSDAEVALITNAPNYNQLTVRAISTTAITQVVPNGMSLHYAASYYDYIVVGQAFSNFIKAFFTRKADFTIVMELVNRSKGDNYLVKVTDITQVGPGSKYMRIDFEPDVIPHTSNQQFAVGNDVLVKIVAMPKAGQTSVIETFTATLNQAVFNLSDSPNNVDVTIDAGPQIPGIHFVYAAGVVTLLPSYEAYLDSKVVVRKFY